MNISQAKELVFSIFQPDDYSKIEKTDVLVFSGDLDKGELLESGVRFNKVTDTLAVVARSRGHSVQEIAWPGSQIVRGKCWSNAFSVSRSFALSLFSEKFLPANLSNPFFTRLLRRASPRIIFTIGGFSALRRAAHDLGIPCVEVLHGKGYVSDINEWFGEGHYLKKVIAFDDRSALTIESQWGADCEVFVVRDYWVESFLSPHPSLEKLLLQQQVPELFEDVEDRQRGFKYRILVTLTWGYAGEAVGTKLGLNGVLPNTLFPETLLDLIEHLGPQAFWGFRLHPVQLHSGRPIYRRQRRLIAKLLGKYSNVDWVETSRIPLPVLLGSATHHITMMSMSSYEAAQFGVPTLALCPSIRTGGSQSKLFHDLELEGYLKKNHGDFGCVLGWLTESGRQHARNSASNAIQLKDFFEKFDL